ncbi:unnamed protein product, partial [Linum tenue]
MPSLLQLRYVFGFIPFHWLIIRGRELKWFFKPLCSLQ